MIKFRILIDIFFSFFYILHLYEINILFFSNNFLIDFEIVFLDFMILVD